MNNQKSKSPLKSVTVWGAVVTSVFGILAAFGIDIGPGEQAEVTNALGIVAGFGITLYGRLRAKVPLKLTSGSSSAFLALLAIPVLALSTGCSSGSDILSSEQGEAVKEIGIEAGKIAANYLIDYGLAELGANKPEFAPLTNQLQSVITFAPADSTPTQLAGTIETFLDSEAPDEVARMIIMDTVIDSLEPTNATASGPDHVAVDNYIAELREALKQPD